MSITKCILRTGLIGGLALGGAALLWPEHVTGGIAQVKNSAASLYGNIVDDPVVMREQLQELAEEYPERIAEVRSELATVEQQIDQLEYEKQVAREGVALTTDDLSELKNLIARAESKQETRGVNNVVIRTSLGDRFDVDEAYTEAARINQDRKDFNNRFATQKKQLGFLNQQRERLEAILEKLEDEYSDFDTKLAQLDRQIDAVERNERLIEMTKQHQQTLAGYEKFGEVHSLKQLDAKLAQLRREQEAQFATLAKQSNRRSYEDRAREKIAIDQLDLSDPFAELEETPEAEEVPESSDIAWSKPVVVE